METELEFLQRIKDEHDNSYYVDGKWIMDEVEKRIELLTNEEEQ